MPVHSLDADNGLYYEHSAPARDGAPTFVFVNALTGNTQAWEAVVAPRLFGPDFLDERIEADRFSMRSQDSEDARGCF